MASHKILISCPVPLDPNDPIWDTLKRLGEIKIRPKGSKIPIARDPFLKEATGVVTLLTDKVDEKFFKAAPKLKVIGNIAVGYNNIDVAAAKARGIAICNTPDVLTNATAELTVGLIIAAARRFKEGYEQLRGQKYKGWELEHLLGRELRGARLGIVGYGRIGQAVAAKAKALEMETIAITSRSTPSEWSELLRTSDFVSIHCPLNAQTKNLISTKEFSIMKPDSYLINTARGEIVDEKALLQALKQGRLRGAALDVFHNEPRLAAGLRAHPSVFALPHLGSATRETRAAMARLAMSGVAEVLSGRHPRNRIS